MFQKKPGSAYGEGLKNLKHKAIDIVSMAAPHHDNPEDTPSPGASPNAPDGKKSSLLNEQNTTKDMTGESEELAPEVSMSGGMASSGKPLSGIHNRAKARMRGLISKAGPNNS